jgi:hypothetical protein
MQVDYQNLSDQAKVFVYPSSRKFYPQEITELQQEIKLFLEQNFTDIPFHFKIIHNRILVFFFDTEEPLPIELQDKLASFILKLQEKYNITLLDKINICFKQGEYVQYQDMKKFRTLLKNKSISKNTIIFNNLIANKYDFENHFEVPLLDSWLSHLVK